MFIEPVVPVLDLLVVGRSPMVQLLADLATTLGWSGRTADLPGLTADDISERTLVVVATQGHGDEEALELVASARPAFIGLVASRKRGVALLEYLAERGVPQEVLDTVRTPVGLDLGHTSHREIAVAVLAELVQLRAAGAFAARPEAGAEPVAAAADQRGDRPGVRHDRDRRRVRLVGAHARARRDDVPLLLRRLPRPVRRRPRALPHRSGGLETMLVSNEFEVPQPIDKVWEFFQDVPECRRLPARRRAHRRPRRREVRRPGRHLRMGPVKLEFAGKAHVAERDDGRQAAGPRRVRLRPEGPRQGRDEGDRPAQRGVGRRHQGRGRPGPADLRRGRPVRPRHDHRRQRGADEAVRRQHAAAHRPRSSAASPSTQIGGRRRQRPRRSAFRPCSSR